MGSEAQGACHPVDEQQSVAEVDTKADGQSARHDIADRERPGTVDPPEDDTEEDGEVIELAQHGVGKDE